MSNLRLKIKLFLLILLGMLSFGKIGWEQKAAAVSCGKCDAVRDQNGVVYGYGCYPIPGSMHGCIATTQGCGFTSCS
jgi:hypothetical protein